jgi:hypothetical protein
VIDAYGIYGDDQFSFKAAGHELNGLKAYFGAGIKQLHFPFLMLLDYCGYRLIGISFHYTIVLNFWKERRREKEKTRQ